MKAVAAGIFGILSSIGLIVMIIASSAIFVKGADATVMPAKTAISLWTAEPTRVNPEKQGLQRVAPRYSSYVIADKKRQHVLEALAYANGTNKEMVEFPAKSSRLAASGESSVANKLQQAIQGWCSVRYRSYDAATNTYRAFSGKIRECRPPTEITRAYQQEMASN